MYIFPLRCISILQGNTASVPDCHLVYALNAPRHFPATRNKPPPHLMKSRRHAIIRNLIASGEIWSQAELAKLLAREGVETTQATLSRDLTEIGVLKGPSGYQLPGAAPAVVTPEGALARVLKRELISIDVGGTLVVLKTPIGHGNALAIELDRASVSGVLGTIAGDDTIFVAARSELAARRIAKHFRDLAELP
jgi:transcriptional regulator of arginine metabolism